MKIIIAGAGKVGLTMARQICAEGHDVSLIDQRQDKIDNAMNSMDVIGYCGSCVAPDVLDGAEASSADVFIAATGNDEANLLSCRLAQKLGAGHTVAILRNPEYFGNMEILQDAMDLTFTLYPDLVVAEEIARVLQFPTAIRIESFPDCTQKIVTMRVEQNSRLHGLPLSRLTAGFGQKILICSIERDKHFSIPDGDFVLQAGDRISVIGDSGALQSFFISAGAYKKPARNVIMLGGSRAAVHLTRLLEGSGVDVTIIEKSRERCLYLAERMKKAAIHCADATNTEVLHENGITKADGLVALTGFDEDNIILGMYANKVGVGKVISKVNNDRLITMLENVFPDTMLSPQHLVAERIAGYVRGLAHSSDRSSIEAFCYLGDPKVTATEFVVGDNSACAGKELRSLPLRRSILLAAVIRDSRSFLPDGSTVLLPGDKVIVVTTEHTLLDLDSILSIDRRKEAGA